MQMPECEACKQRHESIIATHVMNIPKKGDWYLCSKHANAVRRTLLGHFYNMKALTMEDYATYGGTSS